jgi:tetratricopeptide (TPR) repeat protein
LEEGNLIAEFETYLRRAEEKKDLRLMSVILFYIGDVYLLQHNYAAAEQTNRRMYEIVDQIGDKQGMCYAIGDRGIVLSEIGRFEEAIECYRQKLVLAREIGDGYNIWEGLFNWASAESSRAQTAQAEQLLQLALETAKKYSLKGEQMLTLLAMVEHYLTQGNLEEARRIYLQACEWNSQLDTNSFAYKIGLLNAKIQQSIELLDELLAVDCSEEQYADLYFERWQMTAAEEDRQQALRRYQMLADRSLSYLYQSRLAKLTAAGN